MFSLMKVSGASEGSLGIWLQPGLESSLTVASGRAPWLVQDGRPTPPVRTPDLLQTQVGAKRLARVVERASKMGQDKEIGSVVIC